MGAVDTSVDENLAGQLDELETRLQRLREQFVSSVSALDETGMIPHASLEAEVRDVRERFASLRHRVLSFTNDSTGTLPNTEKPDSLAALREIVQRTVAARKEHERAVRERAGIDVLRRVASLEDTAGVARERITRCAGVAADLLKQIQSRDPSADAALQALEGGDHHFCALLALVERARTLSPAEGVAFQAKVREHCGDEVAWAAVTGTLRVITPGGVDREQQARRRLAPDRPHGHEGPPTTQRQADGSVSTRAVGEQADAVAPEVLSPQEASSVLFQSGSRGRGTPAPSPAAERVEPDRRVTEARARLLRAVEAAVAPVCCRDWSAPEAARTAPVLQREVITLAEQSDTAAAVEEPATHLGSNAPVDLHQPRAGQAAAAAVDVDSASPPPQFAGSADQVPAAAPTTESAELRHTDLPAGSASQDPADRGLIPLERANLDLWNLLKADRLGLAFHLAKAVEATPAGEVALDVESSVLGCVALSPLVCSGDEASELKAQLDSVLVRAERLRTTAGECRDAQCMLLLAACLRPALLAPGTGAATVLEQVPVCESFGTMHELRQAVLDYTLLGLDLSPSILKGVREHAKWLQLLNAQQDLCRRWVEQGQQARIKYAPATEVLHRWLRSDHELGQMMLVVAEGDRRRAEAVQATAKKWSEPRYLERQVRETDVTLRGRKADLRPIDAGALAALSKSARQAIQLVNDWVRLIGSEPETLSDFRYRQADDCRTKIVSTLRKAEVQLAQLAEGRRTLPMRWAAGLAKRLLDDLQLLFDPDKDVAAQPLLPRHVLGWELLGCPGLRLDDSWEPQFSDPGIVSQLLPVAEDGPRTGEQALLAQCAVRDHLATARILEYLEVSGTAQAELERLQAVREQELAECRQRLTRMVEQTLRRLERAASYDVLAESDRLDLVARITAVTPEMTLIFSEAEGRLASIAAKIDQQITSRVELVRKRVESTELRAKAPHLADRVEQALAAGDFIRADEYVAAVEAGESLPEPPVPQDLFREFFPRFLREANEFLENMPRGGSLRDYVDDVGRGRSVGPLEMKAVPGPQAESAAKMLETWLRMKARRGSAGQAVRELFDYFGFRVRQVDEVTDAVPGRYCWVEVRTEPVSERAESVLPQYGSSARGRYTVLCVWERPSEEELINLAGRRGHDERVVVLYLGRMSEQRRRDLAYQCRHRRRLLLVVDEAVVLFLCGVRGLRLPVLMRCCLPFTVADPYTTTAGLVPEEMFFGRRLERDRIMDVNGTSLVYGGRQLGKTALLRDVERRYNDAKAGVLVKWIDLRFEGIGETRPIEDIWVVLSDALLKLGVLTHAAQRTDTLHRKIVDWLAVDDRRRIVLLLDEADAFLGSDSKGKQQYQNLTALKGIMDQTQRRFKVVFAGLHNVQRASRDINTPLAHLGDPICIGPLLGGGGEAREALGLITVPLEALGYRFDPPDLPLRILSHTNYYPSLIQLFCKELLDHLTQSGESFFDPRETPPYVITPQHLEEAYQSQKLRKAILHRFNLTLDLDPRYRAVALSIALETQEGFAKGRPVPGFSVHAIRDQMLAWWPAGFREDNTLEAFQNILDEMTGLGVVRRVGETGLYSLRSPNVLNLLGTSKEVDDALTAVLDTSPPPSYEPATFRRALPGDPWIRSPLTAQQESSLFRKSGGVALVFGSRLAGMERTPEFLRVCAQDFGQEVQLRTVDPFSDIGAFRRELDAHRKTSSKGLTLLVVPHDCLWDEQWVRAAHDAIASRRSKVQFLRVVLIGDPKVAWRWCGGPIAAEQPLSDGVEVHSLHPWSDSLVQRWMNDTELGHLANAARSRVAAATGRWARLLHCLADRCRSSPQVWERHLDEVAEDIATFGSEWVRQELMTPAVPVLKTVVELQPVSSQDLRDWLEEVGTADRADHVLRWAELLGFARRNVGGLWEVDSVVARLI